MAKVLIVDDSEFQRQQLRRDLEGAGHQVMEAVDGVDGLTKYSETQDIQLILCDVNMPNMDGLTMVSKISETSGARKVPTFVLTTEADAEMKARAKKAGVRAWIVKPYVAADLMAAIKKVLA